MSLRVPKAEFDGPVEEMVERFGAVPEPIEVMWHNPAVATAASEFGAKAGELNAADESLKSFAGPGSPDPLATSFSRALQSARAARGINHLAHRPRSVYVRCEGQTGSIQEDGMNSVGVQMKLEVVLVPVSDVDRAKDFYEGLGWRMDIDYVGDEAGFRVVQFTPPGSECSIIIGDGITGASPGSYEGLQLTVTDIEAARADLVGRGVEVSEVFHDAGGIFHHIGAANRAPGPAPENADYGSFASFEDPDGNGWLLQEINTRAPGR